MNTKGSIEMSNKSKPMRNIEQVDVEDIKEDFIIDKIGQLKDKSDDEGVDENDLKDNIYTQ